MRIRMALVLLCAIVLLAFAALCVYRSERVLAVQEWQQSLPGGVSLGTYGEIGSESPARAALDTDKLFLSCPGDKELLGLLKFPEIRVLGVDDAPITDASMVVFRSLPNLEDISLEFEGEGVTDAGLSELRSCKNLKRLSIWFADGVTGEFLNSLAGQIDLRIIEVRFCCCFSDDSLKALSNFPHLEEVLITDCDLGGAGLKVFDELTDLKRVEIDLPDAALSDAALSEHFTHVPDVSIH